MCFLSIKACFKNLKACFCHSRVGFCHSKFFLFKSFFHSNVFFVIQSVFFSFKRVKKAYLFILHFVSSSSALLLWLIFVVYSMFAVCLILYQNCFLCVCFLSYFLLFFMLFGYFSILLSNFLVFRFIWTFKDLIFAF